MAIMFGKQLFGSFVAGIIGVVDTQFY